MSTHTRGQLARVIRLTLLTLVTLASTAPIHDAAVQYPLVAAGVAILEGLWREVAPTVPLERVESYIDHQRQPARRPPA